MKRIFLQIAVVVCFVQQGHSQTVCGNLQEGKAYNFINQNYKCAMGTLFGSSSPGSNANTQAQSSSNDNLQWFVQKVPGTAASYLIIHVASGLLLNSASDRSTIQTYNCNDPNEMFTFTAGANGVCSIIAISKNALSNNGQISSCGLGLGGKFTAMASTVDQLWTFTEVVIPGWSPTYPPSCEVVPTTAAIIGTPTTTTAAVIGTSTTTTPSSSSAKSVAATPIASSGGSSMICNKTGTAADWWCAKTVPQAQLAPSVIAADSCFCAAVKPNMTQQDAFNYCTAVGGFLTDIQNAQENVLVGTFLNTLQTSPAMPPSCGPNGILYNGMCYVYHSNLNYEWKVAEAYCQKTYGGHLPSIHSLADQTFLFKNLSQSCKGCSIFGFWVGANNYGNPQNWMWSDNTTNFTPKVTAYNGWPPQPDDPMRQQCMTIVRPDGGWGDWHCEYKSPFPCAYPSAIYPAWISLQKGLSGFSWNLGNNCPLKTRPYQSVSSTSAMNTAVTYTSSMTWAAAPATATANLAVCRMDRNICGRGCTGRCSTCTATNSNTCYQCS